MNAMTKAKDFRPATRGDLRKALSTRGGLAAIAPQSPRPVELLTTALGIGDTLTHDDLKIYQLLLSLAYADDESMPEGFTSVDMGQVIKFLDSRTRREEVRRAIGRLKRTEVSFRVRNRLYEGVSLIHGWHAVEGSADTIHFELPAPLRELMAAQSRYAYLELAALPPMRSKYSLAIYQQLAALTSEHRWKPGGSNRFVVTHTPESLAKDIGFPVGPDGKVHGGKLKAQVLDRIVRSFDDGGNPLPTDFDAVRNFSVDVTLEHDTGRRGRPLTGITFSVTLAVPDHRHDRWIDHRAPRRPGEPRLGARDAKKYLVKTSMWRRAARAYGGVLHIGPREMHELWLIALQEALDGENLTRDVYKRQHRRGRLLDTIDRRGADQACWDFLSEEADNPDLMPEGPHGWYEHRARFKHADRERRKRLKADAEPKEQPKAVTTEAVRRPPPRPEFLSRSATPADGDVVAAPLAPTPIARYETRLDAARALKVGESVEVAGMVIEKTGPHTSVWKPTPKPKAFEADRAIGIERAGTA